MDKTLNMALVGASGVVGKKILQLLEKKGIKVDKLFPLGSSTVGQTVHFQNQDYVIRSLDDFDPKGSKNPWEESFVFLICFHSL